MLIKLYEDYTASVSERLLGYQGETNARDIQFSGLDVEGADTYKMKLLYADGVAYEVSIANGKYTVDGSLLRTLGDVECQIFACKAQENGKYALVKKSNIFKLQIKNSINSQIAPIPTFEQAEEVLDKILNNQNTTSEDRTAVESMKKEVEDSTASAKQSAQTAAEKAEEISGTASRKLDKIIDSENLFDVSKILEGCVRTGVNRVSNENYFTTEDIAVDSGKESLFCGTANADGTLTAQKFRVALFVLEDGTTQYTNYVSVVPIPENAVSFTGTFANSVKENKIYIGYGTSCKGVSYEPYGSFDVLEKLVDTSNIAEKSKSDVEILNKIKSSRISDIMKPVFMNGSDIQIKIIGDSITMGAQGTGVNDNDPTNDLIYTTANRSYYENKAGHCWANSLRDHLNRKFGCTVKNYGVTGSTSWSILHFIDDIVRDEDDICIVCIGLNDRVRTAKDTTYENIKGIYNAITAKGKKCILMSEIPVSDYNESKVDEQDYHSEDIDMIYQKIAAELNIEYIPLFKLMNNYVTEHAVTIDSLLARDRVHPNDNGYDVIFGLVSNALGVATKFSNPSADNTFQGINAKLAEKADKADIPAVTNDLTDRLKTEYDAAAEKAHTHTNKSILDSISSEKINSWDNAAADVSALKTEKNFELIETITVTEENTTRIDRSAEPDGTAYNFEKVYIEITTEASDADKSLIVYANGNAVSYIQAAISTTKKYMSVYGIIMNGLLLGVKVGICAANTSFGTMTARVNSYIGISSVTNITVKTGDNTAYIPVGSVIKIYAVRR